MYFVTTQGSARIGSDDFCSATLGGAGRPARLLPPRVNSFELMTQEFARNAKLTRAPRAAHGGTQLARIGSPPP
jgi:hypothetical protein